MLRRATVALAVVLLQACSDDAPDSASRGPGSTGTGGASSGSGAAGAAGGCPDVCDDGDPCTTDLCKDGACDFAPSPDPTCGEPPATMAEYWSGQATFVRAAHVRTPSVPRGGFTFFNVSQDIEVDGDVWYIYPRNLLVNPGLCGGAATIRTSVCTSHDRGVTWEGCVPMVDPAPGPTECAVTDGDVFRDPDTGTWHFLAQCLGVGGPWNLCHWTAPAPSGPFTPNPANPVVHGGDVWKKILGPGTSMHDEGTPEILEKKDGQFVVTFHGIDDSLRLVRGVAITPDFVTYSVVNDGPIFSKSDCDGWNVPWADGNKCWGGGAATLLREGEFTYMIEEASDLFGPCAANQHWFFGIMRTTNVLAKEPFEQHPSNPIAFATKEPDNAAPFATPACALDYPKLVRDGEGRIDFVLARGAAKSQPSPDVDAELGHYVYRLVRGGPRVVYEFREGPGHLFTHSDVIAHGDVQAVVAAGWTPIGEEDFEVAFDGATSRVMVPANGLWDVTGDMTLSITARVDAAPAGKSALLAGRFLGYWLELYADGMLCAWVQPAGGGNLANACAPITADYGGKHTYALRVARGQLSLLRDDVSIAAAPIGAGGVTAGGTDFAVGSATTSPTEYLGSFAGAVDRVVFSVP